MNVQTELQEKRIARLKVTIEAQELETAQKRAARRLSQRYRIPGFRKGKAPYKIIARYLGEGAILEEAIDLLLPDLYPKALDEAGLEPYGPGQFESIEGEADSPVLVFSVPLQPTVDLGSYREVREDFEAPEVTDEMVNDALKNLQNRRAIIEPKDGPAETGDQVILYVHGEVVAEAASETAAEADETEEAGNDEVDSAGAEAVEAVVDDDSEDDGDPDDDAEVLFHQHDWRIVMGDEDIEPLPGFFAAITGVAADEERSFELTIPTDNEDYDEELRGKTVAVTVTCHDVATRHVPPINDDFAQQVDEVEAETLLELRLKLREELTEQFNRSAEQAYAERVLGKIVEGATVDYPDMLIEGFIDDMVGALEQTLRRQGLDLENYYKLTNTSAEDLRNQYRETAIERAKRSLVLGEVVSAEQLDVDDTALDKEIKTRSAELSKGDENMQTVFENFLGNEQGRRNIFTEMVTQRAYQRLIEIGKGENPPLGPTPQLEADDTESDANEAVEETQSEILTATLEDNGIANSAETMEASDQE